MQESPTARRSEGSEGLRTLGDALDLTSSFVYEAAAYSPVMQASELVKRHSRRTQKEKEMEKKDAISPKEILSPREKKSSPKEVVASVDVVPQDFEKSGRNRSRVRTARRNLYVDGQSEDHNQTHGGEVQLSFDSHQLNTESVLGNQSGNSEMEYRGGETE